MYINEGVNQKYCYACETIWDKTHKKYRTPSKCIGRLDTDKSLLPNQYLAHLFALESTKPSALSDYDRLVIKTVIDKYGEDIRGKATELFPKLLKGDDIITAKAVFIGPELVFNEITKRYRIDFMLKKSFDADIAKDILYCRT